jgi:hypothetical protein
MIRGPALRPAWSYGNSCCGANSTLCWLRPRTFHEIVHGADQMMQIAADPLPDDDLRPRGLETSFQPHAVVPLARGLVLIEMLGFNPGCDECIALQVEHLRSVRLRHALRRDLRINSANAFLSAIASFVAIPCRQAPFASPFGAPVPVHAHQVYVSAADFSRAIGRARLIPASVISAVHFREHLPVGPRRPRVRHRR